MAAPIIETVVVGALAVNCYLVGDPASREAAVIDPGDDAPAITAALERHGLRLARIVLTHAHFDHVGAALALQESTGAPVLLGQGDLPLLANLDAQSALFGMPRVPAPSAPRGLADGDVVEVGGLRLRVIATPGHSPGGISLLLEGHGAVFTGDTLFWGSVGRTDLPGSSHAALLDSLRRRLAALPDETRVYPGHFDETTIGLEKEQNPFLE